MAALGIGGSETVSGTPACGQIEVAGSRELGSDDGTRPGLPLDCSGSNACYIRRMGKQPESLTLDDDVQEELRKLAERSGRPLGVLANAALRDYVRCENNVGTSIERSLSDLEAGRTRTTEEVLAFIQEQRRLLSRG